MHFEADFFCYLVSIPGNLDRIVSNFEVSIGKKSLNLLE